MSPSIAVAADADEQPVRFRRRRLSLLAPRRPPCQCHPSIPVVPKEAAVALAAAAVTLPLPPDDRNRARSFTTGSVNPPAGMAWGGGKINQRQHHDNANFGDSDT